MEEYYPLLEEKLSDATVVSVDNGVLSLRLNDGREIEIFLEDQQIEEIVEQLEEEEEIDPEEQ